jgi:hypothetical protein
VRGDGAGISPRAETRLSAISGGKHLGTVCLPSPPYAPPYPYASPPFSECTRFIEHRTSWKASVSATTPLAVPYSTYGSSSIRHFEREQPTCSRSSSRAISAQIAAEAPSSERHSSLIWPSKLPCSTVTSILRLNISSLVAVYCKSPHSPSFSMTATSQGNNRLRPVIVYLLVWRSY